MELLRTTAEARSTRKLKTRAWSMYLAVTMRCKEKQETKKLEYFIAALSLGNYHPGTISTYTSCIKAILRKKNISVDSAVINTLLKGAGCLKAKTCITQKYPVTTEILGELVRLVIVTAANKFEAILFKCAFTISFYGLM